MSFLTAKSGPSQLNNTNHHDQTLAEASQYHPHQSSASSTLFRSGNDHSTSQGQNQNRDFEHFTRAQSSSSSFGKTPFDLSQPPSSQLPPPSTAAHSLHQNSRLHLPAISPMDGSEVSAIFNDPSGHDEVYSDDLVAGSMSYRSYQHQSDHQHSLSELEKQRQRQMEEWILTDDIISYIEKHDSTYVDDIYGLPPVIAQLVKEAKEELNQNGDGTDGQKKAVSRLQMIRDHLIGRSQGNRTLAVQQGLQMKSDDWASFF
ncbi:hypothetical protein BCR42DRAFT_414239 [Absidia repens]|uniref:Uncharacterized protein n=1 Tax=Absidia repens TaxID=90262 RepID=A0A1X2IIV6_9FUNG|nr:hypothetical protein BCR42DRAFT_414239 [Absidia repens]